MSILQYTHILFPGDSLFKDRTFSQNGNSSSLTTGLPVFLDTDSVRIFSGFSFLSSFDFFCAPLVPLLALFVHVSIGIFPYVFLPQTSFLIQNRGFSPFPDFLIFTISHLPGVQPDLGKDSPLFIGHFGRVGPGWYILFQADLTMPFMFGPAQTHRPCRPIRPARKKLFQSRENAIISLLYNVLQNTQKFPADWHTACYIENQLWVNERILSVSCGLYADCRQNECLSHRST
jgi:hypothetical protein